MIQKNKEMNSDVEQLIFQNKEFRESLDQFKNEVINKSTIHHLALSTFYIKILNSAEQSTKSTTETTEHEITFGH